MRNQSSNKFTQWSAWCSRLTAQSVCQRFSQNGCLISSSAMLDVTQRGQLLLSIISTWERSWENVPVGHDEARSRAHECQKNNQPSLTKQPPASLRKDHSENSTREPIRSTRFPHPQLIKYNIEQMMHTLLSSFYLCNCYFFFSNPSGIEVNWK